MRFFEYPYFIITILVMIIFAMGLIGLYFTLKSVRTAKSATEKSFCGIVKIENDYEKACMAREWRSVIYLSLSLDAMSRLYSESKSMRMYERIKEILLNNFLHGNKGEISFYGKENFVVLNDLDAEQTGLLIEKCFKEINERFVKHGAVSTVRINFGYFCTSSTEVSFKTALGRAKQACSMAEDKKVLYCMWDSSGVKDFEQKIKIENNIESEIDNNRFFLEYQPIVDATTDKIVGAEVLSRLNSETEGILTPNKFLSAVNKVGLNGKFDYYIFEKNCKWISCDKENRIKYVYTINFSRSTLCDPLLAEKLGWSVSRVKYYIQKLKQFEKIRRKGTSRNGRWEVL